MQPDRDGLIGLRGSEGGHVAVGGNAQRLGIPQAVGVIRYPVQRAGEQANISAGRLHVPRQQYAGALDVSGSRFEEFGCDLVRQDKRDRHRAIVGTLRSKSWRIRVR